MLLNTSVIQRIKNYFLFINTSGENISIYTKLEEWQLRPHLLSNKKTTTSSSNFSNYPLITAIVARSIKLFTVLYEVFFFCLDRKHMVG